MQKARANDTVARQSAEWRRRQGELLKTLKRDDVDSAAFFDAAANYIQLAAALRTGRNPASIGTGDVLDAFAPGAETADSVLAIFNAQAELRYAGTARGNDKLSSEKHTRILETIAKFENANV